MARRSLPLVLLSSASMLWAGPASADVKGGVDAWSRGDYAEAIRQWKAPAESGDPDAQFNLAQAYKLGKGVERDLLKAEELYGKAASRGHLKAADNYGLLLFQRGERAKAMPFIHASANRGDPRAQYVLGLAYFNGDTVQKDWVRAYALVSLAQQAGLPQAAGALSQMDQYITLEDRQKSVPLAAELAAKAEATRARQIAAAELGSGPAAASGTASGAAAAPAAKAAPAQQPVVATARASSTASPATAGADYARPRSPVVTQPSLVTLPPPSPPASPKPKPPESDKDAGKAPASGPWRVQLGAFGVAGNADKLWNRVKARPELAGHAKMLVPAGGLTKLQAGGFASRAAAEAACSRLKAGGFACLPVGK